MINAVGSARLYTPAVMVLLGVAGISFLGVGFVMPMRSLYARDVGATSGEIGLMTSAFLLAGFLATPAIGWVADRFGHGLTLGIGLVLHGLVTLAYISVQDPVALIALRALEGMTAGGVLPPARALLNGLAPPTRQAEVLGSLSAAQSGGILLGPAAGAFLAATVGYEAAFAAAAAALLFAAAVVWLTLPRRSQAAGEAGDEAGAPGGFRAALAPPLLLPYGLRLVFFLPSGVFAAIWSLYMADRGASLPLIGLSFTAFALPAMILAPLAGRLSDRRGRYWPIVVGATVSGAFYALYAMPLDPLAIIALSVVDGIGFTFAMAALDGLLADVMPTRLRGRVQGCSSAAGQAGMFVGSTSAGYLYAVDPGAPFLAAAVLTLAPGLALLAPPLARLFPERSSAPAPDGPPLPAPTRR